MKTFKAFTPASGRVGKCDCGGEFAFSWIENDWVFGIKCGKCHKEILADDVPATISILTKKTGKQS